VPVVIREASDITALVCGGLYLLYMVVIGIAAIFRDERPNRKEDQR
jgi:hypothetical protein